MVFRNVIAVKIFDRSRGMKKRAIKIDDDFSQYYLCNVKIFASYSFTCLGFLSRFRICHKINCFLLSAVIIMVAAYILESLKLFRAGVFKSIKSNRSTISDMNVTYNKKFSFDYKVKSAMVLTRNRYHSS